MSSKEKVFSQLRKGYSPLGVGPNEDLNSIFNKTFKPLTEKKDLELFFELSESPEVILRAWGYLGLYYILKEDYSIEAGKKTRFHNIISNLLNDNAKLNYKGASNVIQTTLKEHHIKRICELDTSLVFNPIYDYVQHFEGKPDASIAELLENVLSKTSDSRVELLILKHAKNIAEENSDFKFNMIRAFENLAQNISLKEKEAITQLFKTYLNENKKYIIKGFEEEILRVGAILNINLETEILEFLKNLNHPYKDLHQIAEKYKNNEKFKTILLNKLEEIENPNLIKDILIAIIRMREKFQNWKNIIIDYLNKFKIVDNDLIEELQNIGLFSEDMLINFLKKGDSWQLEFIREFFISNPEKLDGWFEFQNEFIKVLTFFKPPDDDWEIFPNLKEKKELVLKLIIDLKKEEMLKYCLDNVKNLKDEKLREFALFAIISFGNNKIMLELKELLKKDKELASFFKKFWRYLEAREFKFYY